MYQDDDEVPNEMQICNWCEHWGDEVLEEHVCSCAVVPDVAEVRGVCHVFTHALASCPGFQPSEDCLCACRRAHFDGDEDGGIRDSYAVRTYL